MSVRVPPVRRGRARVALAALAIALVVLLTYGLLDSPTRIYYYRVLDDGPWPSGRSAARAPGCASRTSPRRRRRSR